MLHPNSPLQHEHHSTIPLPSRRYAITSSEVSFLQTDFTADIEANFKIFLGF